MTNPRTVLVVEDNPLERKGVAAVLSQEGYDAVVAANGKEALECLSSKPTPDVMLLDMMMSEVDGWQLLKLLRRYPALLAMPVIIVTGLGIASLEWAHSLGAAGLVRKPVEVEHLKGELIRVPRIQSADVVAPTTDGRTIRLRCVVHPDKAQSILLSHLGLKLPQRLRLPPGMRQM